MSVSIAPIDTDHPFPARSIRTRTARFWAGVIALTVLTAGCGGDVESRMQEVRALQDVGQFTESITELREILAISPDLPEANYRLGAALVQTGDPSRAIWALKKAADSQEFAVPAGLMLASAHFTVRDLEESIRAADRVLELAPERAAALQLRAKANLEIAHLDEALVDAERLIELAPDDYQNHAIRAAVLYQMGRGSEAEAAYAYLKEIGEANADPTIRPRACIAPAIFAKDFNKDDAAAEAIYVECLSKYEGDQFLIGHVMGFFDKIGKPERATELVRKASEAAPENLGLRSSLASRLQSQGDLDGARAVLVETAETFDSAAAWNLLAGFYRRNHESENALVALEKVVELTGGGGDELRFSQADVLVDLEQYDRAEEVAKTLEEPIYATLIRGRIQLAQGEPAAALESFEKGIRHWPNNGGARYLAGVAAYELGDWDRAINELREAMRADKSNVDAPRMLARMVYERGDYEQAIKYSAASFHRADGARLPEDYVLAARAFTKIGSYEKARTAVKALAEMPDQQFTSAIERANVDRAEKGPEAAVAGIEASGLDLTDPAGEALLRVYLDSLMSLDRGPDALAAADAAVAANPDVASVHSIRGTVLSRMHRPDESKQAFEKAVDLDPDDVTALAGLATQAGKAGRFAEAVALFDRAAAGDTEGADAYAYSAAQLTLTLGDREGAMTRLRKVVQTYPGNAGARNDLAWLIAESDGDLDAALALAQEARQIAPSADILDTLGWVHIKRGEGAAAVAALEKAHAKDPESASIRFHLGTALALAGDSGRAKEMLQSAVDTAGFEDADQARRELAKLEP